MKAFISYSHADEAYRVALETHLTLLKRQGLIQCWSDRVIRAGKNWKEEIDSNLEKAQLVLMLVSPDFIASDYCYEEELRRALEKHDRGEQILVPIIVRHSSWQGSPLARFQALPHDGKPISCWNDQDAAWLNVVKGIEALCREWAEDAETRRTAHQSLVSKLKRDNVLRVGVFGITGVGKSTLCNALMEREHFRVSDMASCTRSVMETSFSIGNCQLALVDCPGLGEDLELDREYERYYKEVVAIVDLVLWVTRADVRMIRDDQYFIKGPFKKHVLKEHCFYLLVNMVDRIDPIQDWNTQGSCPGKSQSVNIQRKLAFLAGALCLPTSLIIPISAHKRYNIRQLRRLLVEAWSRKQGLQGDFQLSLSAL